MSETSGGNLTVLPSPGSSGPPSPSPSSPGSSSSTGLAAKSATVLSWATFGAIGYAWLFTTKLDAAPWWGPTVALVANALPGGMLTEIAKTLGLAVIDKIPGRGAGK